MDLTCYLNSHIIPCIFLRLLASLAPSGNASNSKSYIKVNKYYCNLFFICKRFCEEDGHVNIKHRKYISQNEIQPEWQHSKTACVA